MDRGLFSRYHAKQTNSIPWNRTSTQAGLKLLEIEIDLTIYLVKVYLNTAFNRFKYSVVTPTIC